MNQNQNQNQKQPQTGGYRPFSPTSATRSPSAGKSTVKRSPGSRTGHGHGHGHRHGYGHGQLQNQANLHKIMSLFQ